ncbi:glycoside hydrolase family 26 protein [Cloacibacterium normanense]|uniref:glycoside hydrolase family 26 protein n=1 Tax=Cloacibacterium normanense TaxID=237258 RepID=UPI00352C2617
MKFYIPNILWVSLLLWVVSCYGQLPEKKHHSLSDKNATPETENLYQNLILLQEKGFLFGHQDDLAYGVKWRYEEGRSDIKDVTGDYPALYGWDLGGIEHQKSNNIDGVPFKKMKNWIKEIYDRGGISTISWHMDNPLTMRNSWDTTSGSLRSILPNGEKHQLYLYWLDEAAQFLGNLKGSDGKKIPILYRPFHELTGNWFWWCKNNATPEEFKEIWRFTIHYLRETKKLNNLIIVYNTADFKSKEEFLEYYPGDDVVDVLSFDKYQYTNPVTDSSFITEVQNQLKIMNEVAVEHQKPMAIAETGYEQIPYENWWTKTLTEAIGNYKISFVLLWRNHGWQEQEKKMHYYAPYKGQLSEKDFIEFYNSPKTFFQKDITQENIYK